MTLAVVADLVAVALAVASLHSAVLVHLLGQLEST